MQMTTPAPSAGDSADPALSEAEWSEYRETYQGYCTECKEWTRACTEPDAEDHDCPTCGAHSVIGAEVYLMHFMLWPDALSTTHKRESQCWR